MVGSILRIVFMMWLGMRFMSESPPSYLGMRRRGANGRNQVIAGCGNGSLRLFDLTLEVCLHPFLTCIQGNEGQGGSRADIKGLPTQVWHEHSAEVHSVDWNNIIKDQFVSASWDHTVKIVSSSLPRYIVK